MGLKRLLSLKTFAERVLQDGWYASAERVLLLTQTAIRTRFENLHESALCVVRQLYASVFALVTTT